MAKKTRKVNRLLDLTIVETSLVDNPANDMAKMESYEVAKRADEKPLVALAFPEPEPIVATPAVVALADSLTAPQRVGFLRKLGEVFGVIPTEKELAAVEGARAEAAKTAPVAKVADPAPVAKTTITVAQLAEMHGWTADMPVSKGMYGVASLAALIQDLNWLCDGARYERQAEGDSSTVPDQLTAARDELGQILISMATEEVAELKDGGEISMALSGDTLKIVEAFVKGGAGAKETPAVAVAATPASIPDLLKDPGFSKMFEDAVSVEMEKRGATHSAATKKVAQDVHDKLHDMISGQSDTDDQKAIIAEGVIKGQTQLPEEVRNGVIEYVKRGRFSKKDHSELTTMHDAVKDHFGSECKVMVKTDSGIDYKKFADDLRNDVKAIVAEALNTKKTDAFAEAAAAFQATPEPVRVVGPGVQAIDKSGMKFDPFTGLPIPQKAAGTVVDPNAEPVRKVVTDPRDFEFGIKKIHSDEANRSNVSDILN